MDYTLFKDFALKIPHLALPTSQVVHRNLATGP